MNPTPRLPVAAHAARVPAAIDATQLQRLRDNAWALPQVLAPADWSDAATAEAERALDEAGFVQLQKGMGSRPSRGNAPAHLAAALAHLEALGAAPPARTLMLQRRQTLEGQGLVHRQGRWQRQGVDTVVLGPGARVPVAFRHDVDEALVWRFFIDGELPALQAALGPLPPHPQRDEVRAHLLRLAERSEALSAAQLGSLWPRLVAACATPLPLPELLAACSRAQDRWEHAVAEQQTMDGLHRDLAFQGYPDSFAAARRVNRRVFLYVGPPNSGKTHAAFERLAQALDGAYLAPLRLLALEGRDRLVARGVPCSLLTGEENVPADGARVVSSTIEMVDTRNALDVAVVDEAQMLFDASRGWAWTQAIVGVAARELIIICSAFAVPAIQQLLALCGETPEIRRFERKQHVQVLARAVPLWSLERGDAVVAFSRRDVLRLRDAIAEQQHVVSVIYGALPPEVRRREAERFASGAADVLVATDAIGMGLNLPIRRVLFSTMEKFDGVGDRPLDVSEVHQIAGRAGRFGLHEEGFAGVLKDAEPGAAALLK
ncbi:MAG: helicase-related protein, partial [Betaproteobacteria bacterium]